MTPREWIISHRCSWITVYVFCCNAQSESHSDSHDILMACKYSPLGTPRGRYDEHSSKSSLSCETKVDRTSRIKPNFRRWCLIASWHSGQGHKINYLSACLPLAATWNLHNTTKNFAPNLQWGCQSHRLAVNKRLSVSSGKRIIVCKKVNRASNSKC
jgi:hypothetical protein